MGESGNAAGPVVRTFDTGANRDVDTGKYDYEAFLSPLVLDRYGAYMHKNRFLRDGTMRDGDNWQKGIPLPVYMKSGWRHFMDWWRLHRSLTGTTELLEEALCAILFNVMGYLHELLKLKRPDDGAIQVVAAVRYNPITDRYWVCRRPMIGSSHAGLWEFPGGKIEPGETEPEALHREMHEEFGVPAIVKHKIDSVRAEGLGKRYVVHYYSTSFPSPEALRVHSDARWCTIEELQALSHLPSGAEFVRRLVESRRYCSIVVGPRVERFGAGGGGADFRPVSAEGGNGGPPVGPGWPPSDGYNTRPAFLSNLLPPETDVRPRTGVASKHGEI